MPVGAFPVFRAICNIGGLLYLLFVYSADKSALLPDAGSIYVRVDWNAAFGEAAYGSSGICDYYSSGFKQHASQ